MPPFQTPELDAELDAQRAAFHRDVDTLTRDQREARLLVIAWVAFKRAHARRGLPLPVGVRPPPGYVEAWS